MWMNKWPCGLVVAALGMGAGSALAAPVAGQGTWEQTLQGRDLDGNADNGFEAYYDTTQNLTWLADANVAATNGVSASGLVLGYSPVLGPVPNTAAGIAYGANVHGISGWHLPSVTLGAERYITVCEPGRTTCDWVPTGQYDVVAGSSQLQQLLEVTLGNRSSANGSYVLENTGPFKNVQAGAYWSSKFMATSNTFAGWQYNTSTGQHVQLPVFNNGYVWLARAGDVAAVPETSTWALMAFGLAGIWLRRARKASQLTA